MTMNARHLPKHFRESIKDSCQYCRRTPALWQQVGSEKVCAHCGTRIYNSAIAMPAEATAGKSAGR
ncbi:MAG: hypothetical protein K8L97_29030 [Anaerolineae bacterium]|nr:hypothetical protein [Anaerolineae bacterium]